MRLLREMWSESDSFGKFLIIAQINFLALALTAIVVGYFQLRSIK